MFFHNCAWNMKSHAKQSFVMCKEKIRKFLYKHFWETDIIYIESLYHFVWYHSKNQGFFEEKENSNFLWKKVPKKTNIFFVYREKANKIFLRKKSLISDILRLQSKTNTDLINFRFIKVNDVFMMILCSNSCVPTHRFWETDIIYITIFHNFACNRTQNKVFSYR